MDRCLILNKNRARYWISCGAEISYKVQKIFNTFGIMNSPWIPFGRKTTYIDREKT